MRRIAILCAALVLALAVAGGAAWRYAGGWAPPRAHYPQQGVDVTDAMGAIDWPSARASAIDFAYARATMGAAGRDARFAEHWAALHDAGIPRGAILEFSLCDAAADQAGNFTATVPRESDALPAAIDLEFHPDCPARPDRAVVLDMVRQIAATMETHSGKPVMLRISPAFEEQYLLSSEIRRPLWAVGQFFTPDALARPWRMWQASRIRRIEGAERPVNWNVVAP